MLKHVFFLVIALKLLVLVSCEHDHQAQIKKKMEADGIVPSLIPVSPPTHLHVTYTGDKKVHLGDELTPTDVKEEPHVTWNSDPHKLYTLIMFDPDAPSRENPKFADVKHWLVGNIPGEDINHGDVIAEYFGSGPPKNTGLHRYIFLVYEQKEKITFDEPKSEKLSRAHRLNWSLKEFLKKYDLGNPLAGDYFKAQWDPYVDERNKHVTN